MVANILIKPTLQFSNISATTAAFTLAGGLYGITITAHRDVRRRQRCSAVRQTPRPTFPCAPH
jgi:hypothetical protein